MSTDLKFGNLDYNNAVLFLFIGYVGAQIPAGFILAKIPPAFFLTGAVCVWGVVSMCCGFIHTIPQMLALRFLVGVAEAVSRFCAHDLHIKSPRADPDTIHRNTQFFLLSPSPSSPERS